MLRLLFTRLFLRFFLGRPFPGPRTLTVVCDAGRPPCGPPNCRARTWGIRGVRAYCGSRSHWWRCDCRVICLCGRRRPGYLRLGLQLLLLPYRLPCLNMLDEIWRIPRQPLKERLAIKGFDRRGHRHAFFHRGHGAGVYNSVCGRVAEISRVLGHCDAAFQGVNGRLAAGLVVFDHKLGATYAHDCGGRFHEKRVLIGIYFFHRGMQHSIQHLKMGRWRGFG